MKDSPPDDAIRIVPTCPRLDIDDVPAEFAVQFEHEADSGIRGWPIPGGCLIWGRYESSWRPAGGTWHVNASARGLVFTLLEQLEEQKRLNIALAERCAGQSELLTKRAAKVVSE